jgi:hypothetical protein
LKQNSYKIVAGLWVAILLLAACGGCRSGNAYERYVPGADAAKEALTAALKSWQSGSPIGRVAGTSPPIDVIDTHRKPGQRLQEFAILGPAAGEGPRCFAVRLTLDNPRDEKKVRFVVFGIDPLFVMRYEDYVMMEHMDHNTPQRAAAITGESGSGAR